VTRARPELRRSDFSLSEEQVALRDSFRSFFAKECPPSRVRTAAGTGFDAALWNQLVELGLPGMGVASDLGGDGGSLVDVAVAFEEIGRALAPVPAVENCVAARRMAALGGELDFASDIVTLALYPARTGIDVLLPSGAVATRVLALVDDRLVLAPLGSSGARVENLGDSPAQWWTPSLDDAVVLATSRDAEQELRIARLEWQLMTAAMLVGAAEAALDLAVQYANDRVAFGVPIGTFQAVAHPLVDVATAVRGAERLVWKACWFREHEPDAQPELTALAYLYAAETASLASKTGIHVQGGLGFTLESDMQLYFRASKTWTLMGGDPQRSLDDIADDMFGRVSATSIGPEKAS
jgi:alkylation response protein AidB-like acyl-CoA dehydrogenase